MAWPYDVTPGGYLQKSVPSLVLLAGACRGHLIDICNMTLPSALEKELLNPCGILLLWLIRLELLACLIYISNKLCANNSTITPSPSFRCSFDDVTHFDMCASQ